MKNLTQEYLMSVLSYCPNTGLFTRLTGCNSFSIGDVAGALTVQGYIQISIKNKLHRAHRLAFLYMKGRWPEEDIDHINRAREDNRWCNLRECSRSNNTANRPPHPENKSGYKGVSWSKCNKKWRVEICCKGVKHHLGLFDDIFEAAKTYNKKAVELFGQFAFINEEIRDE